MPTLTLDNAFVLNAVLVLTAQNRVLQNARNVPTAPYLTPGPLIVQIVLWDGTVKTTKNANLVNLEDFLAHPQMNVRLANPALSVLRTQTAPLNAQCVGRANLRKITEWLAARRVRLVATCRTSVPRIAYLAVEDFTVRTLARQRLHHAQRDFTARRERFRLRCVPPSTIHLHRARVVLLA